MGYSKEEIAKILSETRVKAGLTQLQAANAIQRNRQTLASWETGKSQPDIATLFELFRLYNTSLEETFHLKKRVQLLTQIEQELILSFRQLPDGARTSLLQFVTDAALAHTNQ